MDPESHALAIGSQMRDVTLRRWLDDAVDMADAGVPYRIVEPLGARHPNYASKATVGRPRKWATDAERKRASHLARVARMKADPVFAEKFHAARRARDQRRRALRACMAEMRGPGWIPCADAGKG